MSFIKGIFSGKKGSNFQAGNVALDNAGVGSEQTGLANNQVQSSIEQQQNFVNQLQAQQAGVAAQQQGLGNLNDIYAQQQAVANGQGPNPAQAELAQATGANVANQAALMAGQRGAGQNVGLMARQAAQQGGALQQQAAGQGATMQAQQSLAALNQLGGLANSQAAIGSQQVGEQQGALGQLGAQANAQQQNLLNATNQLNQNKVAMQSNMNNANQATAATNAKNQQGILSKVGGAVSKIAGGLIGGPVGAVIGGGDYKSGSSGGDQQQAAAPLQTGPATTVSDNPFGISNQTMNAYDGGVADLKEGGKVSGKAQVKGDSIKNDTVPAMLSPKEIVIPRSITMHPNAPELAAQFVREHLKKGGSGKKNFDEGGMADEAPPQSASQAAADITGDMPQEMAPQAQAQSPQGIAPQGLSVEQGVPAGMEDQTSEPYAQAVSAQKQGIEKQAAAEGMLGQREAAVEQQAQGQLQQNLQSFQQHLNTLNTERQGLIKDIQNGHVDPNRFIGNMSTGQKVATAIGLILGGLSGSDAPMEFLDKQIEQDIDAQKTNLNKKQTLLSANMQEFGNLRDASQMTKAMMMDMTSLQLKAEAAKAQDPLAKARALQAAGQLDMQVAPMMSQIAIRKTVMSQMSSKPDFDPARAVSVLVPKEHQKEVFKEIKTAQDAAKSEQAIMNAFDQAAKENTLTHIREPVSNLKIKALALPLIHDMEGRVNEFEQKTINDLIPTRTDSAKRISEKREALQTFLQAKKSASTAKGYGIDLERFAGTNPQTGPVKTMNGVKYQKVQGGWKRL